VAITEHWTDATDQHHRPAEDYLSLLSGQDAAHKLAERLRTASLQQRKTKDLILASDLTVLGPDDVQVAKEFATVRRRRPPWRLRPQSGQMGGRADCVPCARWLR
jgi:hypothetical protein